MALILSIETSTSVCSAALHENGNLIANEIISTPQSAASQLAVQIDRLLSSAGDSRQNLSAVAVAAGPGSYTGLRIGTATAKGICYGLDLPLIAIDSLTALASSAVGMTSSDLYCPMIDARRMEVYCSLLDASLEVVSATQAKVIDHNSFADQLANRSIVFFGNGASKCRGVIKHRNARFLENVDCTAASMGGLAFRKFSAGQFEDLILFEPNYLKNFVAKTKTA